MREIAAISDANLPRYLDNLFISIAYIFETAIHVSVVQAHDVEDATCALQSTAP